jgi:hypothetical protein
MNSDASGGAEAPRPFAAMQPGTRLPVLQVHVSAAANERYWRAAGVEHPALAAGALYPPIAANLTVLCFGQGCAEPVIQTRQHLRCHGTAPAGSDLVTEGRVVARYDKRGRTYVDVETVVRVAGREDLLWTSGVSFTPAATLAPRP